jgi:hypothetical protein
MKLVTVVATVVLALAMTGCPSKDATEETTEPELDAIAQQFAADGAIVQQHGDAEVAWTVDEDGNVKAALRDSDGEPIKKNIDGELNWKDADGNEQSADLKLNDKTGLLEAKGVALPEDAAEVGYNLKVKGDEVNGNLELPSRAARLKIESVKPPAPPPQPVAPPPPPTSETGATPWGQASSTPSAVASAKESKGGWGQPEPSATTAPASSSAGWSKSGRSTADSDRFPPKPPQPPPPSENW